MAKRVQVIVIDAHPIYRNGVRWSLEQFADIQLVAEAVGCADGLEAIDRLLPDLALVGIDLGACDGLELTRQLRRRHPQVSVILLAERDEDEQLFLAIRAGAAAYASKEIDAPELGSIVRRVAKGEYLINDSVLSRPHVASRVLSQFRELAVVDESSDGVFSPLTRREIEILESVAQGLSNKEIAHALGISDQTVKNHITSILRKLAVNDRTQAVIYALRHGWINVEGVGAIDRSVRLVS